MTNQNNALATRPENRLNQFMRSDNIMARFEEILGERGARMYVSSVLLAVANNDALQECTHASIVASALRAASLSLSCDPAIGQAYLVPYGKVATFVVGYKGLRDMALRTNKYRFIHADKIYKGEGVDIDRITGSAQIIGAKESNEIAGWVASFEMTNGFRKSVYMTREEIHEHAKKYSKGYERQGGVWKQNPAMMEKKTVLRQLLSHWGVLDSRDALFLSQVDAAEDADLQTIDADFVPVTRQREDVSEEDVLAELGYDPEPAQNVSRETSPAPVVTETYPMSPDMAFGEKDSNGKLYAEYTTEQLAKHSEGIAIAIGKEKDPEKITALQFKQAAIGTILQYRANHPEA